MHSPKWKSDLRSFCMDNRGKPENATKPTRTGKLKPGRKPIINTPDAKRGDVIDMLPEEDNQDKK